MHKHKWIRAGRVGWVTLQFRCKVDGCDARKDRPFTKFELKRAKAKERKLQRRHAGIHKVWHSFMKKFQNDDYTYKYEGYDLMMRVRKWGKKYPKDVFFASADDYCHAGADLVIILHRPKYHPRINWGTTIMFLSQFKEPAEIFLYPGEVKELLKTMTPINRMHDLFGRKLDD